MRRVKFVNRLILVLVTVIVFSSFCNPAFCDNESKKYLDIGKIHDRIQHLKLDCYSISDTLKLGGEIDSLLFLALFQDETTEREFIEPDGDRRPWHGIKYSKCYLLTQHSYDHYDIVTILKKEENFSTVYWLAYHKKDIVDEAFGQKVYFKKGELANYGYLASKRVNYNSYSTFTGESEIKNTTVENKFSEAQVDSTILYLVLCISPYCEGVQGIAKKSIKFENGKLVKEFSDEEETGKPLTEKAEVENNRHKLFSKKKK